MKPSGIPWIGDIPVEWSVLYLFQLAEQVKNRNLDLAEKNLLSLSYGKIKRKNIDSPDGLLPASFDGYNIIERGDVVLRLTDLQNDQTSLRVGQALERGIITSAYTTVRPRIPETARYLFYALDAFDLAKGFYGMGSGVRQGLNWPEVKQLELPLPPLPEQRAIAAFLDEKYATIDAIVEEAKAGIAEYADWQRSIIFHAVTKGIPEDAAQPGGRPSPAADTARGDARPPMKDSGVEWIGKCPVSWKILPLKALCEMESGKTLSSEQILSAGPYPVYGANGLRGFYTDWNTVGPILLVGRQGALCGNVHKAQGRFWATEHALRTRPKDGIELGFLFYLLTGMNLNQYVSQTAAQPGLAASTLLNVRTLLPSLPEQRAITAWLDEKCAAIDALVEEKKKLIEDLRTYKKSLIYETVTGKMRVAK